MDLNRFLEEINNASKKFFPLVTLQYNIVRNTHLYVRITFQQDLLIDIYANCETERKDFALIHKNERIYGIDNLKGWHYHPFGEAGKHVPCEEPSVEEVFENMKNIIEVLTKG
ncbi:MAG TPA: hypothetical protein VNN20_14310 [Thermodesulfobacteriota bacterium]|nr:hypothetical protein [Thermodesulfobacteriota bacterium]